LNQYTQFDFIALVERYGIPYHEKKLGQLFCDNSSQDIIDMLLSECEKGGVTYNNETSVESVEKTKSGGYKVTTSRGSAECQSLIIATGGLSIPKIGATKFGYDIARQFGLNIIETRAALVPLTFQATLLERCKALSGLSVEASISANNTTFEEGMLFTHRGLSGPSVLQISSYWNEGEPISVNLDPQTDVFEFLKAKKSSNPKQDIHNVLSEIVPQRLAEDICGAENITGRIADLSNAKLETLGKAVNGWHIKPSGTEGYRTAEVTLGGVDTKHLSSKTMEVTEHKGLYFIGEVIDVTGHLGGFNFQWAWSSGYVAGMNA
jgi:predicted Rossmann fold flavoprotein